jgi:hypothetical protein
VGVDEDRLRDVDMLMSNDVMVTVFNATMSNMQPFWPLPPAMVVVSVI